MLNWCGVYSGTGHVNSRFTCLRLFPYYKPNVLNFSGNIGIGFHIVGKNLVCFNCWPFPDSFPCEGPHLNFQWLAELLTSWTILLQELTVVYLLWFYTFCRIRGLLTYSMVQSPSWEANWFAASQEIPHISQNPKVHYHTQKRSPPVSILDQPIPVHIPTSHLVEIHPNIIHPSTPRSPQWSPSLRLPHEDPIHPPLLTHTRHLPSPSHSSWFYHLHNIGWGVQII